jgi:MurNAc alpha-1-phosphate uridylyltransferase
MIKKAIILSAGFGKRLNPLTLNYPKPLLKIGKETLLSNTIKFLEKLEIKEAIINVHYLGNQISEYIRKNKFNLNIKVINEEKEILDTGGGILNALKYLDENFICINPDTIWNSQYIEEFKSMEGNFFLNEKKCNILVVDKLKSFDKNLKGDFNLESGLVSRKEGKDAKYIFTGLQIINSKVFTNINDKVFSVNKIWNELIKNKELFGLESNVNFLHVSTLDIYNKLNIK